MLKYDEVTYDSLATIDSKELMNTWLKYHPNIVIHHFEVRAWEGTYASRKTFHILYEEKENENV